MMLRHTYGVESHAHMLNHISQGLSLSSTVLQETPKRQTFVGCSERETPKYTTLTL